MKTAAMVEVFITMRHQTQLLSKPPGATSWSLKPLGVVETLLVGKTRDIHYSVDRPSNSSKRVKMAEPEQHVNTKIDSRQMRE